jgi:hypothetical protein
MKIRSAKNLTDGGVVNETFLIVCRHKRNLCMVLSLVSNVSLSYYFGSGQKGNA